MEHEDVAPDEQVSDGQAAGQAHAPFDGLDERQSRAIIVLLREPMLTRAAETLGVNERTLRRWLGEPRFKRAYYAARREAYDHAVGLLQRYAPMAVNILAKVMTEDRTPPAAKIAAAVGMLKFGREGIELDDMAQRIDLLEQAADTTAKWQGHP